MQDFFEDDDKSKDYDFWQLMSKVKTSITSTVSPQQGIKSLSSQPDSPMNSSSNDENCISFQEVKHTPKVQSNFKAWVNSPSIFSKKTKTE